MCDTLVPMSAVSAAVPTEPSGDHLKYPIGIALTQSERDAVDARWRELHPYVKNRSHYISLLVALDLKHDLIGHFGSLKGRRL